jgi:hypothetical protein
VIEAANVLTYVWTHSDRMNITFECYHTNQGYVLDDMTAYWDGRDYTVDMRFNCDNESAYVPLVGKWNVHWDWTIDA